VVWEEWVVACPILEAWQAATTQTTRKVRNRRSPPTPTNQPKIQNKLMLPAQKQMTLEISKVMR
jgi:hypothetical protein